ncbi:MAG: DUF2066 domain-containing protein [Colwellia sp.]|nr:DUF2066 domain-containing protein [Colwellia sp.]
MIKNCFVFCCTFIFSLSASVNAIEVKDLYQAKVPVSSQAPSKRSAALKKAMQAVLIKVGGQVSVLKNDAIKRAVKNHRLYVSQYSYSREEIRQSPLSKSNNASNKITESLVLLASFDENKINKLLKDSGLALWGSLRPEVLLWLIEEDKFSRQILSESSHSNYPLIVANAAQSRGLPVVMPLMDFTDSTNISMSDLWGRFSLPVNKASQRYSADAIVVIRVSNSSLLAESEKQADCRPLCDTSVNSEPVVLDWTLFDSNGVQSSKQQYQGNNSELLLAKALSDITDVIYQSYALSANTEQEMIIDVVNIDSIGTYVSLTQFLKELSSVNSVELLSAQGSNRRFNLKLIGSKMTLLSSLKLDNKLKQYIDPLAEVIVDAVPIFYWDKS